MNMNDELLLERAIVAIVPLKRYAYILPNIYIYHTKNFLDTITTARLTQVSGFIELVSTRIHIIYIPLYPPSQFHCFIKPNHQSYQQHSSASQFLLLAMNPPVLTDVPVLCFSDLKGDSTHQFNKSWNLSMYVTHPLRGYFDWVVNSLLKTAGWFNLRWVTSVAV